MILLLVVGHGIQRLLILAAERRGDNGAGRGNHPEILPVGPDHLDSGTAGHVDAPGGVNRASICAASLDLGEFALVSE